MANPIADKQALLTPTNVPALKRGIAVCIFFSVLSTLLSLLCTMLLLLPQEPIEAVVHNRTDSELRDVVLSVTGARHSLGTIPPRDIATAVLRPKAESGLDLEYRDQLGKHLKENLAGYVSPDYSGRIRVRINPDGKVEVDNCTYVSWPYRH